MRLGVEKALQRDLRFRSHYSGVSASLRISEHFAWHVGAAGRNIGSIWYSPPSLSSSCRDARMIAY